MGAAQPPSPALPAPAYGPPPDFFPPQPPPKKKKGALIWTLAGVGGVLVLCLIFGLIQNLSGAGSGDQAVTAADNAAAGAPAPATKKAAKPKPKPTAPGLKTPVRDGKFEFVVNGIDCGKKTVGNEFLNEKAQGRFCLIDITVKNIGNEEQMFDGSSQKAYDAKGTEYFELHDSPFSGGIKVALK